MPGNTSIILATILMQRDKAVWGDDAQVFDPDRWADMGKEREGLREGFMSWNYGPRMVRGVFTLRIALWLIARFCFLVLRSSLTTLPCFCIALVKLILNPRSVSASRSL